MTTTRIETIVLLLTGLFFLAPGIWAFAAPGSFYHQLAPFPPYNRHLIHDIGAFQIGIGAALILALKWNDARFVVLAGAAAGAIVHFVSHIIDHDRGGNDGDAVVFGVVAAVLIATAVLRWRGLGHNAR